MPQSDLKLGARFQLTQLGAERCPKFCGDTGTVVGFARNSGGIRVLLDGDKETAEFTPKLYPTGRPRWSRRTSFELVFQPKTRY